MNHLKLLFLFLVAIILIPTQQTGAQNTNLSGHIDWEGWSFDYSVGADFDGLAINDVTYKGIQIMGKGNFPAMPVYYNGNACGPYLDRLDTGLSPVTWANDALLVAREFTVGGEQWYEIGNRQFIGDYDIYQVWYFNSEGVIDAHLFSRGLQCNTFHVHYPHWRFDFDIAGASNDQILRQTTTGLIPYTTEFDVQATAAENHGWIVKDTLTNDSVSLQLDTGSWNVDGTIVPETAYSNNRVIGRAYNSGEADWTGSIPSNWGSGAGNVGYGNGENIDDTDIALWYAAYLPHSGSDGADLWHSTGVRISVNLASDFVYLLNPGNLTNYQGEQVIRQMVADTSQPPLTYAATGLPDGLTIDPNSGEVSGQVTTVASYETAVTVTDDAGESRSVSFTWQIDDLDSDDDGIPNATEQSFFSYTTPLAVIPPDGNSATQTIDLSAYDVSIGAQVDLSGIQANGDLNGSTEHFTLNINNGEYESSDLQTDVQCNGVTDLVSPVQTTVSVIDIGGGTPGIRLRGTSSAEVDDLNGCRSGIEYRLTVAGDYVNDSDGDGAEDFLDLDSDNDGALDVIEAGGTDADEDGFIDDLLNNQAVLLNPPDSDGDEIPDYLDLTSSGGVFDINGTPYAEFDTNGDGTIDNNDVEGGTDADNDGIDDTIDGNPNQFGTAPPAPNQPPVISPILDQITDINSVVNLIVSASDPEGDSNLTFEITGLPTDLSLENSTGTQATISGTATELGTSTVSVTVTDSAGESATRQFVWTIQAVEPPFSCTPGLLHERWEGIPGGLVSDLTSHSSYPSRPTSADVIDQFVTDRYVMDNYGVRVRGYLIAPETGTYRFWIASDDRGELWLSSDSDPANVALIGSVSGWTFPDEHDKYSGQRSAEINLIAGKRYYIEGLMKQYRGADHLTVWWETPSQARAFITSADACAFEISGIAPTAQIDASPTIGFAPLNVSLDAGNSSDSDGEIVTYQWDLGDGTSASGTTVNHSYGSPGVYHAVLTIVDNDGRTDTATVQITINVDPDDIGCSELGLTFERFDNIYGTAVSNLLNASNYPDNPTTTQLIPQFEIPVNASDAYGARVHGYIAAPTTGEYTFWLASDDNGLLRLSSDVNPSNLVDIATVSTWAPSRQWDWRPEQQSAPITLQAGELYYVEALMKEQGGGDNLSVAWQTPGGTRQLIPSQVLCPAVDNGAPPVAVIDANPTLGAAPLTVMLDGTASSDADGPIASYSWQFGDGTTSNAATPGEHIYGTSGTYEVVLTVTDADDRATTTTQTVIVTEPGGSIACHTNGVQYARWNNVWSGNVVDLIVDARYPSSPDETSIFSELVVPTDAGDVYGARMQAYLVAPESGLYTFWVASDNEGQLWLSSDVTTENVAQIAQTSWSPEQGWDFSSSQKSAEIPLIAGQAYYLEGLHQTSWGGDYYAVAWQTPSGTRELIPNSALCVYDVASERTATHEQAPPLIGLGRLSLSPLAQSMPETLYPELALILVADQPLREDAFALRDEFEQMVLSGERLTEEFISELSSLYSRIYTVASPELQAWMSSKWNQIDVEQYESTRANMAWTAANYSSVPTAVGLNQTSAGQTNVWFIVVVLLGLLTTAAFAWRGRRLH